MNPRLTRTVDPVRMRVTAAWVRARARFLERVGDPERGDVPSSVWMAVGMILLAIVVVAVITAAVNSQLAKIPN